MSVILRLTETDRTGLVNCILLSCIVSVEKPFRSPRKASRKTVIIALRKSIPGVTEELGILGSEHSLFHDLGDLIVADQDPLLHRELAEYAPIVGIDVRNDIRTCFLELVNPGQVDGVAEDQPYQGAENGNCKNRQGIGGPKDRVSPFPGW